MGRWGEVHEIAGAAVFWRPDVLVGDDRAAACSVRRWVDGADGATQSGVGGRRIGGRQSAVIIMVSAGAGFSRVDAWQRAMTMNQQWPMAWR